jgi:hypothetical protein
MSDRFYKQIQDECGALLVEWIGIGAMLAALAIGVYTALDGNGSLRGGIAAVTSRLAINFGGDMLSRGPRATRPAVSVSIGHVSTGTTSAGQASLGSASTGQSSTGQTSAGQASSGVASVAQASNGFPSLGQTSAGQLTSDLPPTRAIVDPTSNSYILVDPRSGARMQVRPGTGVSASLDPSTGLLHLEDPTNEIAAELQPFDGQATLIDPGTGVRTTADLATLEQIGIVEVRQNDATPGWWPIFAPVLGVPAILPARG